METTSISKAQLGEWLEEARRRTLGLVEDLDDGQLMGERLAIVNPLLWEIGHVAWFQEKWSLRHLRGEAPINQPLDAPRCRGLRLTSPLGDLHLPSVQLARATA